jgi:tRNA dimethylallyltransferase
MWHSDKPPVLVLSGPTASGKSEMALAIARDCGAEIVSADSMQVYRHMDIGTAKPTSAEQAEVRHHLIDVCEPDRRFTVSDYQELARIAIADIHSRGRLPLIVGGTGFYIDALLQSFSLPAESEDIGLRSQLAERAESEGLGALYAELLRVDPESASRVHPNDQRRIIRALEVYHATGRPMSDLMRKGTPPYESVMFALDVEREQLYQRINLRVDKQIADGLVGEVAWLLERYGDRLATARQAIGYKEIIEYLEERVGIEEALETLKRNTRRYAKRQLAWFRRYSQIEWLPATTLDERTASTARLRQAAAGILQAR